MKRADLSSLPAPGSGIHVAERPAVTSEGKEEEAFLLAAVRQVVALASVRAVAKESGMSHGAIYNHRQDAAHLWKDHR